MADAILDRADKSDDTLHYGSIYVHDPSLVSSLNPGGWTSLNATEQGYVANRSNTHDSNEEIVLVYNWADESNNLTPGYEEAAADDLFASLLAPAPYASLRVDGVKTSFLDLSKASYDPSLLELHFIGHSRGAVLNSLVTSRIGHFFPDLRIDQVTSLDPHPQIYPLDYGYNERQLYTFSNVTYADNYFQQDGLYELAGVNQGSVSFGASFDGVKSNGAWNAPNPAGWNSALASGGSSNEHSDVHNWYYGTITDHRTRPSTRDQADSAVAINPLWYSSADAMPLGMGPRNEAGFNNTRIVGGARFAPTTTDGSKINPLTPPSVFNGGFDYANDEINEIPGWERHGGSSDADVTNGRAHLGEFLLSNYTFLKHNPLYIPKNATAIAFDLEVTDTDTNDVLDVYLGDQKLNSYSLATAGTFSIQTVIPASLDETVQTIEFRLNYGSDNIDSDLYLDNVRLSFNTSVVNPTNHHIYYLLSAATWTDSQAMARSLGGNLVTINDAAENAWVFQTFGQGRDLWIGLNDQQTEGTFTWVSGETPGFTNWRPGEPDNFSAPPVNGEDFVHIYGSHTVFGGQWNDAANDPSVYAVFPFFGEERPIQGVVEAPPPSDTTPPTASLASPNSTVAQSTINADPKHIDITFSDASGIDAPSILDSSPEFTLSGTAAGGVSVSTATPTLVNSTTTTATYRYLLTGGGFGLGPVTLNFAAGAFRDAAPTPNPNAPSIQTFSVLLNTTDPLTLPEYLPKAQGMLNGIFSGQSYYSTVQYTATSATTGHLQAKANAYIYTDVLSNQSLQASGTTLPSLTLDVDLTNVGGSITFVSNSANNKLSITDAGSVVQFLSGRLFAFEFMAGGQFKFLWEKGGGVAALASPRAFIGSIIYPQATIPASFLSNNSSFAVILASTDVFMTPTKQPEPTSPGLSASPGQTVSLLAPTFSWSIGGAVNEYGLYISKLQPNGTYALVFDSTTYPGPVTIPGNASTYSLPVGILQDGGQYRWNMNAKINGVWGPYTSRLYFKVATTATSARLLWTNRDDTDNGFDKFGANAALARTIVDKALSDWGAVIRDFNYGDGTNTFKVLIGVNDIPLRAYSDIGRQDTGQPDIVDGKPRSGFINIDDDGRGAGWYFDPNVNDDTEFTSVVTSFKAQNPAVNGYDLYRTVLHEIGHVLGMVYDPSLPSLAIYSHLKDEGVAPPYDSSAKLISFNFGGAVVATLVWKDDGGHFYEGPSIAGRPDLPIHPNDLLDRGQANDQQGMRELISDLDASVLRDAYGYTIALPSSIHVFALPGDANGDNKTDFNDLVKLAQNYNKSGGKEWSDGDFTGDGNVDFNDLVKLAQNYNTSLAGAATPAAGLSFQEALAAAFASLAPTPTPVKPKPPVATKPNLVIVPKPKLAPIQKPKPAAKAPAPVRTAPPVPFGTKPIKPRRDTLALFD